MNKKLNELEGRIGYRFSDRQLLTRAMTHSSYANEHRLNKLECNERLEFLGDSVLEVVSSDFLYHKYPDKPEGDLTKIRASIVCEPTLAYCAEDIELGNYLLLGKGEEATGGRGRASVVSDAMEALIGAIYLDGGFANAKEFILRFIMNDIEHKQLFFDRRSYRVRRKNRLPMNCCGKKGPITIKSLSPGLSLERKRSAGGPEERKRLRKQ